MTGQVFFIIQLFRDTSEKEYTSARDKPERQYL